MSTKQTPNEVEEVKDLEQVEEVQDLTEAPEEIKEAVEEVKAPGLRGGGLRGAADPDMIQKHIDNFLAMLCGETPVDSNVRTSAEYWLKRLATGEGGGSTKKVYCHPIEIQFSDNSVISCLIFNNDGTALTKNTFVDWIQALYTSIGAVRIPSSGGVFISNVLYPMAYIAKTSGSSITLATADGTVSYTYSNHASFLNAITAFLDGVNAIN